MLKEASQGNNSLMDIPQLNWLGMMRGYVIKSRTILTYLTSWPCLETTLASNSVYTCKVCWMDWGDPAGSQTLLNIRNKGPEVTFRSRAMSGWVLIPILLNDM